MNQNVQQISPNGQTQAPQLQLSDSSNNLFNSNPSDLDFVFDEKSGNFMLDFKKPQQTNQPDTLTKGTEQSQPDPQQQSASPNVHEERFGRIEAAIVNLAGVLQGIQSVAPQGQQQQQEQTPELDINSGDFATNLLNILNSAMDKRFQAFEERIKPLTNDVSRVNQRLTLTDLGMKYGKHFIDMLPTMSEHLRNDPNPDYEKLYLTLAKVSPKQDSIGSLNPQTQTTNGSSNGQPQVDDLLKKADQMSTIRDGVPNGIISNKPQGRQTIAQIVEQSLQEISQGRN